MADEVEIKIVVYKKIVEGDLSKFIAESNISDTGGGARDLRFSPAKEFWPVFERMFEKNEHGILEGQFFWNNHTPTDAIIYPPTNSRPNEVRITRINEYFPNDVIPDDATDCILLIILDKNNKVWPCFTSQNSLKNDNWHPKISKPILAGLDANRGNKSTPMGFIDIEKGVTFTNGR